MSGAVPGPDYYGKRVEDMTEEELVAALKDPQWRLRNLYYIKDKDRNTVLFAPNEQQERFLKRFWFKNIIPKARQLGFSTIVQILMLDTCLFVPQTDAAIIAQDRDTAKKIRNNKIIFAYDRLPDVIKAMVPLVVNNETELGWANKSGMTISTSVRGGTIDFLHVSEYGIICKEDPGKAQEIQEGSLPAVPQSGIEVIESTVESPYGIFSDMVKDAMKRQELGKKLTPLEYRLHFAAWWETSEYEMDPEGVIISPKDHAYFNRIEGQIGRDISLPKRAWYVTTRDSTFGGTEEKMWRQYPSTLEEAFTVAKEGLWLANQMALVRKQKRITHVPLKYGIPVNTVWDLGVNDTTAIWLHQFVGPNDHFIRFFEGSGEAPVYYARNLQEIREEWGFVWGKHFLPHDADQRKPNTYTLTTYKQMYEELGLSNIEVVPRTPSEATGIDLMRQDFGTYWFDEEFCKEGIEHLDGFAKVFNKTQQIYTDSIAENGHENAADSLRQLAQAKQAGMTSGLIPTNKPKKQRRRGSAMAT